MKAKRLSLFAYRNFEKAELFPDDAVNIFYGDNAQGKTNLLEALWLFSGGRSFRGAKDAELIRFDQKTAKIALDFETADRPQDAQIVIDKRRHATLNGVPQRACHLLTGHFCAVIFSPVHMNLIDGGPENRRRFLDAAICQTDPSYIPVLTRYHRILIQRNNLFKQKTAPDETLLSLWDEQMIAAGVSVIRARQDYTARLAQTVGGIYEGLSVGRESLSLQYGAADMPSERDALADWLRKKLLSHRRADEMNGCTTAGPHRDNIEISICGLSARQFGSQGQKRSAVVALKLAEATLLSEEYGDRPVILLDDVMSELDVSRQDFILNHIRDFQVFITCCDPSPVLRLTAGKTVEIKNGAIIG